MPSGKTLELAKIQKSKPDPLCIKPDCGLPWSAHVKKKPGKNGYPERLKKYESYEHRVVGQMKRPEKLTKAERKAWKKRRRG